MTENEQIEPAKQKVAISPFAQDKTYGEKMYHRIFDVGINFWLNLATSAAFTFWVKHYEGKLWEKPKSFMGKEFSNLGDLHKIGVEELTPKLTYLPEGELRGKRADSIMNVFTLQMPGHFIMIPSVWLGAKVKPAIVKYFNRKHYGEEAMHSADLVARQHAIETEERPTLAGAIVGRLGAMAINMSAGAMIGSENNLINKIGEKTNIEPLQRFGGIDPVAGRIGEHIGTMAGEIAPTAIDKTNKYLSQPAYGWSPDQHKTALKEIAEKGKSTLPVFDAGGKVATYTNGVKDLSRFLAQDVMYTLFTSSSVHPVVNFARKYLPGMTYKPKAVYDPEFENLTKVRVPRNPLAIAPTAEPAIAEPAVQADAVAEEKPHHKPHAKITHAHHESTLHRAHEHAGAQTV